MNATTSFDSATRPKQCVTCRKSLSIYMSFKNCDNCRAKNRLKEKRRVERRRDTEQFLATLRLKDMVHDTPSGDEENFNAKENFVEHSKSLPKSLSPGTMATKPRLPKLHELEGKEKKVVMQEMKMFLIKQIQDSGGRLPAAYSEAQMEQLASGDVVSAME